MQNISSRLATMVCLMLLALCWAGNGCNHPERNKQRAKEKKIAKSITISGAYGLYPLISQLAFEYNRIFPNIRINVTPGSSLKGMSDMIFQMVDMGMYSKSINDNRWDTSLLHIAIARDAILPIGNASNPYLEKLNSTGITQSQLRYIFVDATLNQWGQLTGEDSSYRINVFTRTDISGSADIWSSFLGTDQVHLTGTGVYGEPGMVMAIRNDIYGIGYASLRYIFDNQTGKTLEDLKVIPIDLDMNGKLDPDENLYSDLYEIDNAVMHNAFPTPPSRTLYLIIDKSHPNDLAIDFVRWIFENGQQIIQNAGYVHLDKTLFDNQLNKIYNYLHML